MHLLERQKNPVAISVLMANYNNSPYIQEAIGSVLSQTLGSWELVICDDASTDNSVEIIAPYTQHDNVRLIQNPQNLGYTRSLMDLLTVAKNDIVAILDSDDVLTPGAIEYLLTAFQSQPESGFIYSKFDYCDQDLNFVRNGYSAAIPLGKTNLHCDQISHLKAFRKSAYDRTSGYDETILYAEDKDIAYKLEEVCPVQFIDKVLYQYRVSNNSQSHQPVNSCIGITSHVRAITKAYGRRRASGITNLSEAELIEKIRFLRQKQKKMLAMESPRDPGGFIVCHEKKFMFVAIAKNGITSLKSMVLQYDYNLEVSGNENILHDLIGYGLDGYTRISVQESGSPRYRDYLKFAVYRDPLDRFLSLYSNKIAKGRSSNQRYYLSQGVIGASLTKFCQFAEQELRKPAIHQDEHIRRQCDYYSPRDVDYVVHLDNLDSFLAAKLNLHSETWLNRSGRHKYVPSITEMNMISRMYETDAHLQPKP